MSRDMCNGHISVLNNIFVSHRRVAWIGMLIIHKIENWIENLTRWYGFVARAYFFHVCAAVLPSQYRLLRLLHHARYGPDSAQV